MSSEKKPTLMWAIPTYGTVHRRVYESHLAAMGSLAKEGIICEPKLVVVTGKMGLASASNEIVRVAMQLKPDYVFWTEQDMILPANAVSTLLKHAMQYNLEVLSGVYFLRGNGQPCLFRQNKAPGHSRFAHTPLTVFPKQSLFELEGCPGVGCILFKTEIFGRITEPWWDDQEGKCGQDIYFYTRLREEGKTKVWVDSSVVCGQIDDDEPKHWTTDDYEVWLKENGHKGFIHGDLNCIPLGGENADYKAS